MHPKSMAACSSRESKRGSVSQSVSYQLWLVLDTTLWAVTDSIASLARTSIRRSIAEGSWAVVIVNRSRELPTGTVGGRIGSTKIPCCCRNDPAAKAVCSSPINNGWMGVSDGINRAANCGACCNRRVLKYCKFSFSLARSDGRRAMMSTAAKDVAAT